MVSSPILKPSEKDAIYRELIARTRQSVTNDPNSNAYALTQRQTEYARYLDQQKRYEDAWRL